MARSPQVRLLQRLEIVYDMHYHPWDFDPMLEELGIRLTEEEGPFDHEDTWDETIELRPILTSPYLTNLRVFELGYNNDRSDHPVHTTMLYPFDACYVTDILSLLEKCPRLEELYLNAHLTEIERLFRSSSLKPLRVLQYYFGTESYAVEQLAQNANLRHLTTLRLHPGRGGQIELAAMEALLHSSNLPNLNHLQLSMTAFGDDGVTSIIDSGILKRLRIFDISAGGLTDDGAKRLAACPDLKNLERLDVSRNALTQTGIDALEAIGISVVALDQHEADETDYLTYEVDIE